MKDLTQLVDQYLQIRRAQGAQLVAVARILHAFCEHIEATNATRVSVSLAVEFATAKDGLSDRSIALRLSAVRGFCRWAHTLDPDIDVPPEGLLKARPTRNVPYIYTAEDIAELIAAAGRLQPEFRGTTMATLIGLMAVTGIRTGEACALDLGSFNQMTGTLRITGKYGKSRLLPLHPSTIAALTVYARTRAEYAPAITCPALLVSCRGIRLRASTADRSFRQIVDASSLAGRSRTCRPRLMDLRHTFAVATMLEAYKSGQDPRAVLPVLSTWMGHTLLADTYWYLSCTPDLMQAAAQRFERQYP